ncbi:MAG: bifunctional phosphoribosylaminoimidazolecarboxamide formyltransferase/IMP cyclohydrolase, partial [Leptospiraceae bacterium]|nr:bifunctional phosphoribosylaminoimidazolecarboxamide formyltransferase/IMP cyclohydrolase [Leptospiraceae bacterium]
MIKIQRALISVSNKNGLIPFAKFLESNKVEILSTGGTLKELKNNGINAIAVEDYTGFPEMLDGRVKTLHPKIHGGLLGDLDKENHKKDLETHGIGSIDLVIVNLYPFIETVQKPGVTLETAIENIDIGGPSMLRSAAKNNKHTVVITEIEDYDLIQKEMESNSGSVSKKTSFKLAAKVFAHTALYDSAISGYFQEVQGETYPEILTLSYKKKQSLRYGENPHQNAAFYAPISDSNAFTPLQGKELSFNNMLDFDAAFHSAALLPKNTVSIIKHLNPCGLGSGKDPLESFELARRTDPVSAFGGVIGVHGEVDEKLASKITENFVEGVIAEKYTPEAKEVFSKKPNVRIIEIPDFSRVFHKMDYRPVHVGMLLQDRDYKMVERENLKVVTKLKPTDE